MNKLLLPIICIFFFFGCSCEQQMHRLTYRCPELFTTKNITVPVYVPEYNTDTMFFFSAGQTDTLYIEKDRVKATLIRTRDTLRVYINVPADTVYKNVNVEVPKPVIEKKKSLFDRMGNVFLIIMFSAIGAMVTWSLFSRKKIK